MAATEIVQYIGPMGAVELADHGNVVVERDAEVVVPKALADRLCETTDWVRVEKKSATAGKGK